MIYEVYKNDIRLDVFRSRAAALAKVHQGKREDARWAALTGSTPAKFKIVEICNPDR
jgi:hypothetical protein